jgi:TRAP-type C4-dicarboxylate transport system permease small subunit
MRNPEPNAHRVRRVAIWIALLVYLAAIGAAGWVAVTLLHPRSPVAIGAAGAGGALIYLLLLVAAIVVGRRLARERHG